MSFKKETGINYPLVSDSNTQASRAYGVLYDKFGDFGLEGVSKRSVFVLDKEGIVRFKWVTEDPKVPPDHRKVVEEVKKLAG